MDFIDAADRVVVRDAWRGSGQGPDADMEFTRVFTLRTARSSTSTPATTRWRTGRDRDPRPGRRPGRRSDARALVDRRAHRRGFEPSDPRLRSRRLRTKFAPAKPNHASQVANTSPESWNRAGLLYRRDGPPRYRPAGTAQLSSDASSTGRSASGDERRSHSLNSGSTMYQLPSRSSTSPLPCSRTSAGRTREWLEKP
jgi:hypothetical protein